LLRNKKAKLYRQRINTKWQNKPERNKNYMAKGKESWKSNFGKREEEGTSFGTVFSVESGVPKNTGSKQGPREVVDC